MSRKPTRRLSTAGSIPATRRSFTPMDMLRSATGSRMSSSAAGKTSHPWKWRAHCFATLRCRRSRSWACRILNGEKRRMRLSCSVPAKPLRKPNSSNSRVTILPTSKRQVGFRSSTNCRRPRPVKYKNTCCVAARRQFPHSRFLPPFDLCRPRRRHAARWRQSFGQSSRIPSVAPNPSEAVSQHVRAFAGALGCLLELLDHPVALELRDVVDEQDAVKVVDLVLEHGREQPLGQHLALLAVAVEGADANGGGALDLGVIFGDRQAALLVGRALVRSPKDLGVDEDLRRRGLLLLGDVDDEQADRLGDLDRREPDARRVVHRLDHVVDEPRQRRVDTLDRLADQAELGVGQGDDVTKGHEGKEPFGRLWRPPSTALRAVPSPIPLTRHGEGYPPLRSGGEGPREAWWWGRGLVIGLRTLALSRTVNRLDECGQTCSCYVRPKLRRIACAQRQRRHRRPRRHPDLSA